jgi:hypothetical protein
MRPLRALLALSLLLDATGAAANGAARAAARARPPATPAVFAALGTMPHGLGGPASLTPSPIITAGPGFSAAADAPSLTPAPGLAPTPADAPQAPADGPRAQAADMGWLGDHEEVLLNGSPEEVAQIESQLASGRISTQHPGSEAERRALGIVRGVTNDWTPRMFESAVRAGTPRPAELSWYTRQTLARADKDLREAGAHAAGPLEKLALDARGLLARASAPRGEEGAVAWL